MRRVAFVLLFAGGLLAARSAAAHHSFAANPHFHFSVDVKDAAGAVTRWRFEGYPPNMLVRQGWRRDETLMLGATVTVEGWAARDDSALGAVRWVTLADGRRLAGGPPAGTGGR
jgi:hypothetical protein